MIKYTHQITNLPIPGGLEQLQNAIPAEMKSLFQLLRSSAAEDYNCIVTITTGDGWRTDVFEWPDRSTLDNFLVFANTITDYDKLLADFGQVINSIGGSISRTEQEV